MDNVPSGAEPVRFDPSKAGVIALRCLSALFSRKERRGVAMCKCVCVVKMCVCVRGRACRDQPSALLLGFKIFIDL